MKSTDEMNFLEDEFDETDPDGDDVLDDPDQDLDKETKEEDDYSEFVDEEED